MRASIPNVTAEQPTHKHGTEEVGKPSRTFPEQGTARSVASAGLRRNPGDSVHDTSTILSCSSAGGAALPCNDGTSVPGARLPL